MSNWQGVFIEPAQIMIARIGQFVANVLLVLIILVIGWLISRLIKTVVTKVLRTLKLDEVSDRIELDSLLAKGGINYSLSELLGIICYWLAILVTFVVAINAVGLTIAADLLGRIVTFIPQIIAAIFILIAGMFVATLLRNIVRTAANNAGVSYSNALAKITEVVVMVFAVVMALDQLSINARIIEWSINIILGATGLGLALSFGLGCKDIAARAMSEWLEALKKK